MSFHRRPIHGFTFFFALLNAAALAVDSPPPIPVGYDAYRQWDQWPMQRIGMRTSMRSTYDRAGGNESADAGHFLYQLADDTNVTLDVEGPGILTFARYNHWHGSPWHYDVDGRDFIVKETATANPPAFAASTNRAESVFIPEKIFPEPLAWTWSRTRGADLTWVPVSFEKSFRMAYSRTHYGTGYYIYQQFVKGTKLSRPIRPWNDTMTPPRDVMDFIGRAGGDLLPAGDSAEGRKMGIQRMAGTMALPASNSVLVAELTNAPASLRALEFSVPRNRAVEFGRTRLRITWDAISLPAGQSVALRRTSRAEPSVDSPLALFFGAGTLYNRDNREFLVKSFPAVIRFDNDRVFLSCYFPMPFFRSARIELVNTNEKSLDDVRWSIRTTLLKAAPSQAGYFHATYADHPNPVPGKDLVLLDTRETEGGGDWSGTFVGTSFIFSDRAYLGTLEGDPRFFFDDSRTPQAQGTGTEEWGGGGDYWGGQNMTLPFAGHPTGAKNLKESKCDEDKIESAYRFLLGDLFPFGKNALICLEHGGTDNSTEHYQTVTYWYGTHAPSLIQTDTLKVGDAASEESHRYSSPDASAPYEINSRYEWGVDTLNGKEIYPAQADTGRKTTGVSEFNLKLEPDNFGVMLRRKLDYQYPNQRAEVSIAAVKNGKPGKFKSAGAWYLAGGNTCVYSHPKGELGATEHIVETSNRRFRDDEFLVPLALTTGQSEIRVRVKFTPVKIPLFPGQPLPDLAWSEIRYDAWCFVTPRIP